MHGYTHGDVNYIHMVLDQTMTGTYMSLFCQTDYLVHEQRSLVSLPESRPAVQVGCPA